MDIYIVPPTLLILESPLPQMVGARCTFKSICTVVGKSQKRFVIVYTALRISLCFFLRQKAEQNKLLLIFESKQ